MSPIVITLAILIIMIAGFISGKFPLGMCGMFAALALMVAGVLTPAETFAGFANTNVVIMFSMMVVAGGLMRTHLIENIMKLINRIGGGTETSIVVGFGLVMILMSQFMNAFVALACLLPFVTGMCEDMKVSPTRVVFPLCIIGNVWVVLLPIGLGASAFAQQNAFLEAFGAEPVFGVWTLALTRLVPAILTTLYSIFILPKYCPAAPSLPIQSGVGKKAGAGTLSKGKETCAYIITILTVLMMMTSTLHGIQPVVCASVGAFLTVLLGILNHKEAIASVGWDVLFMFAGIMSLASALTKTGASDVVANAIQTLLGGTTNPWIINIAFSVVICIMTQFLSNNAMINVFTPLALMITTKLGMNPVGIMGLMWIAGCASFITPMATPGIPLSMQAAGYNFKDVVKMGAIPSLVALVSGIIWCTLMFPAY